MVMLCGVCGGICCSVVVWCVVECDGVVLWVWVDSCVDVCGVLCRCGCGVWLKCGWVLVWVGCDLCWCGV